MKKGIRLTAAVFALVLMFTCMGFTAFAASDESAADAAQTEVQEETETLSDEAATTTGKAWSAAICIGIVAAAGAIGMALSIMKSVDGIARQPEAAGQIRTSLMLGLVFVETAIIYALIVAILIVFVL